jgi:glycerophosphoryl diester phosphodiesterase
MRHTIYWQKRVGLILLVFLLATVRLSGTTGAIEIIAHRGASGSAPENTLPAVIAAWEQGADAVEIDVHLTVDGRIVVIHDRTTTRTTGAAVNVAQHTVEELRRLTIMDHHHPVPSGEKIPTLAEVVQTVPDGKRLFIDIKCGSGIVPELTRVLRASGKRSSQLVAITWRFHTARAIKRSLPNISVYILRPAIGNPRRTPVLQVLLLRRLIWKCYHAGLDGVDVEHTRVLNAATIRYAHQLGMRLTAWTVNSVPEARRLQAIGVDGITTDRPLLLRHQLGGDCLTTMQRNELDYEALPATRRQ